MLANLVRKGRFRVEVVNLLVKTSSHEGEVRSTSFHPYPARQGWPSISTEEVEKKKCKGRRTSSRISKAAKSRP